MIRFVDRQPLTIKRMWKRRDSYVRISGKETTATLFQTWPEEDVM